MACALLLFTGSYLSYQATVNTESMMVLVLTLLYLEGALAMVFSVFDNVVMSKGVFSSRFPYGFGKVELSISIGYGLLIFASGVYVLYSLIFGSYNLELLDIREGHTLIIVSACLYLLHLLILHKAGLRNLSSKSESVIVRQELVPIILILVSALVLMLIQNKFVDPIVSVGVAIVLMYRGLRVLGLSMRELRLHRQKDYSYKKMCVDIAEKFQGEILSARMKKHMDSQRFCRIKIGFKDEFPMSKSSLSRKIEQYLLDEFDLDKAHVQMRVID